MSVVTNRIFELFKNNYMFWTFSGWAIIRLRLEYQRKLIYYDVGVNLQLCQSMQLRVTSANYEA
jgi:hypothetical protein